MSLVSRCNISTMSHRLSIKDTFGRKFRYGGGGVLARAQEGARVMGGGARPATSPLNQVDLSVIRLFSGNPSRASCNQAVIT